MSKEKHRRARFSLGGAFLLLLLVTFLPKVGMTMFILSILLWLAAIVLLSLTFGENKRTPLDVARGKNEEYEPIFQLGCIVFYVMWIGLSLHLLSMYPAP